MESYQFMGRLNDLCDGINFDIIEEAERLAGKMNLDNYGDTLEAPEICLYAALLNIAERYKPLTKKKNRAIANKIRR